MPNKRLASDGPCGHSGEQPSERLLQLHGLSTAHLPEVTYRRIGVLTGWTVPYHTVPYRTVLTVYATQQYGTVPHGTVPHGTVPHSSVQHKTAVPQSNVPYSTAPHCTVPTDRRTDCSSSSTLNYPANDIGPCTWWLLNFNTSYSRLLPMLFPCRTCLLMLYSDWSAVGAAPRRTTPRWHGCQAFPRRIE